MSTLSTDELIRGALTSTPQAAADVHRTLVAAQGEANAPSLVDLTAALSKRGETLGVKVRAGRVVQWTSFPTDGASAAAMSVPDEAPQEAPAEQKEKAPASTKKKVASAKKAGGAKKRPAGAAKAAKEKQQAAEDRRDAVARVQEVLAEPLSAFALFGFAQRNLLKKQKPNATVKETVKAIGERWLLLTDAEREKYEALAVEDQRYVSSRPAAASAATEAASEDVPMPPMPMPSMDGVADDAE